MNEAKIAALAKLFEGKGYNPIVGTIYQQQEKAVNWYRGEVNDFHFYTIKTINGSTIDKHKPSLNMGKKVCEDWASLLWNERSELVVPEAALERFNAVAEKNNLYDEIGTFTELSGVYGTGVIVEYIADGETKVQFVYGDSLMIIDYENTTATAIAILQEFTKDKKDYIHIQYLTFNEPIFRIQHEVYESKGNALGNETSLDILFSEDEILSMEHINDDEEYEYYIEYETLYPHFQIYKPAIANNFDIKSAYGIGFLFNVTSILEGCDTAYHSLIIESENKRSRIFLDNEMTKTQRTKETVDVDGESKVVLSTLRYFDVDETIFQTAKLTDKSIEIFDPEFKATEHVANIQLQLDLLSSKAGLGTGYYSFNKEGGMTATEVIHKNSDTWRNRQKHLNRLRNVLIRMMYSIMYLEKVLENYNGEVNIDYDVVFDDSIVVDDEKRLETMKIDANDGFVPKWRYIMERYKLNEEEARLWVKEAQEEDDYANFGFVNGDEEQD